MGFFYQEAFVDRIQRIVLSREETTEQREYIRFAIETLNAFFLGQFDEGSVSISGYNVLELPLIGVRSGFLVSVLLPHYLQIIRPILGLDGSVSCIDCYPGRVTMRSTIVPRGRFERISERRLQGHRLTH